MVQTDRKWIRNVIQSWESKILDCILLEFDQQFLISHSLFWWIYTIEGLLLLEIALLNSSGFLLSRFFESSGTQLFDGGKNVGGSLLKTGNHVSNQVTIRVKLFVYLHRFMFSYAIKICLKFVVVRGRWSSITIWQLDLFYPMRLHMILTD